MSSQLPFPNESLPQEPVSRLQPYVTLLQTCRQARGEVQAILLRDHTLDINLSFLHGGSKALIKTID